MNYDLSDRVALVTGGSRGLGAAISLALAQSGAKVAINYFSRTNEARALQEKIIKSGGKAEIFKADVTDERQVKELCDSVITKFGPIDILVANATLVHIHKPIEELVWQDMLDHLNFFVKSPLLLVQQVLSSMKKRKYGRIINIGSEVFERGIPRFSSYVSAKGAQLGLTRSWANELGSDQITVNLVAPGWIPTEMHDNDPVEMKLDYAKNVPLKRMGDPADIGEIVAFLASDAAKFITGQRITVNGGNTMV
jgi:3-oxoacyl-[acyl-carrier protein] reductase